MCITYLFRKCDDSVAWIGQELKNLSDSVCVCGGGGGCCSGCVCVCRGLSLLHVYLTNRLPYLLTTVY